MYVIENKSNIILSKFETKFMENILKKSFK